MQIITFEVPGDAVAKARPRFNGKTKRTYTPAKTKHYETHVKTVAMQHAPKEPLTGPLEAKLIFYRPMLKSFSKKRQQEAEDGFYRPITKADLDNLCKSVLDAMNGIVFKDDAQIVTLISEKYYSHEPRVYVEIVEM